MSLVKKDFKRLTQYLNIDMTKNGQEIVDNTYNKVDWNALPEKDVISINEKLISYLNGKKGDKHIGQELSELIFVDICEKN